MTAPDRIERYDPDYGKCMRRADAARGEWVRYDDHTARIAAARTEGREQGLREAARQCVTHERGTPMHSPPQLLTEAHDAILALIPAKAVKP